MKIRFVWSALAASAVLLAAGTALPGGPASTTDNLLIDYNNQTRELFALPTGRPIATYLHNKHTVHLAADLSRYLPPDPCFPLAQAWNVIAAHDARHGIKSTAVFDLLLALMSNFQCHATVTSDTGSPQPIVVIYPTAQ
jgi:hypothetical protein